VKTKNNNKKHNSRNPGGQKPKKTKKHKSLATLAGVSGQESCRFCFLVVFLLGGFCPPRFLEFCCLLFFWFLPAKVSRILLFLLFFVFAQSKTVYLLRESHFFSKKQLQIHTGFSILHVSKYVKKAPSQRPLL